MGHSFGGAVAIRTAVIMPVSVAGVVTFATQSAGCEVAGALTGRPLLLFHGDRDELLPPESSHVVAAIAGHGDVDILPGDGHLLAKSDDIIVDRLDAWLPAVLGLVTMP
jgi:pimeloyl-ACP methyl ester carboxylesterase